MNSWLEYLAFLHWQEQVLMLDDFHRVFQNLQQIHRPEDLASHILHPRTRLYVKDKKDWWKQAEKDHQTTLKSGLEVAWPYHPSYPPPFLNMPHPPALISWKGLPVWKNRFLISIVGSRHPHTDTLMWMDTHLSVFLKNNHSHIGVVSGGARGVDQKAHALSLAYQIPTLCFLPCGLEYLYPRDLKKWLNPVLEGGGAFVSLFGPSQPMRKSYFHIRNEALAHLSPIVFIAQASLRSGTMVTARFALSAGTTVCTLPASPLYSAYKGNLSLINDGAFMMRDELDFQTLYEACKITSSSSPSPGEAKNQTGPPIGGDF